MNRNKTKICNFDTESVRVLLDSSLDAAFLFNSSGELVALNREGLKRLRLRDKKYRNKPADFFIGKRFIEFYPEDFIQTCNMYRKTILKTKKPEHFKYKLEEKFIDVIAYPVKSRDYELYSFAVYARDITKEVIAELQVKKSEEKIMSLVEQMYEGYIITDREGKITYVNRALKKITGYESGSIIGKDTVSLFPVSERKIVRKNMNKLHGLEKIRFEAKFLTPKKNLLTILLSVSPIIDEKGIYNGYQSTITDITQIRESRDKLQYRTEFEKKILEIATGFINLHDSEIDHGILKALGTIGSFNKEEKIFLYVNSGKENIFIKSHEWNSGFQRAYYRLPYKIDIKLFPYFSSIAMAHKVIQVPDISALGPEAGSETMYIEKKGLKSFLIVPMILKRRLTGLLGIGSITVKTWSEDEISMIKTALSVIAMVLERKDITGSLIQEILNRLSAREREFAGMLARGYSWPGDKRLIGKKMNVLPGTLDKFMARIREKVSKDEYGMMIEYLGSRRDHG